MKATVKEATRALSKKDKLVLENSNFTKISEIVKQAGSCTIENPDIAVHATFPKKDGGSFDLYVIHGICSELGQEGWFQIGSDMAGDRIMTFVREMTGEEDPYSLRIETRRSRNDPSRTYYNVDMI